MTRWKIRNGSRTQRDQATAAHLADAFFAGLDPYLADSEGPALLSQQRCVDHLLDLYNTTDNTTVRQVIGEVLADIRHLSSVRADEMRSNAVLLAAAAAVEAAFLTAA
jgi:hypothetical protein